VILNVLAFLFCLGLSNEQLNKLFLLYGLVPARYTAEDIAKHFNFFQQVIPFFSSLFLHGGFLHLIMNMWMLWIFGRNVEDHFGHWRFLALYMVFGLAAGGLHLATNLGSEIPTIGASGCIAGIMGAYFILFPHTRVMAAIPIFFFIHLAEVYAPVFFLFWFIIQFFYGALSVVGHSTSNVAWWAHIGGFLAGILAAKLIGGRTSPPKKSNPFNLKDIEDADFRE
jgi:hypothetical protein